MEDFVVKIDVDVKATMVLSEVELRALDALAGYGIEPFLKVFYAQMGKHYLQPHEAGLRALFKTIGEVTPGPLRQATSHRHWLREAAKERPMARVKAAPTPEEIMNDPKILLSRELLMNHRQQPYTRWEKVCIFFWRMFK